MSAEKWQEGEWRVAMVENEHYAIRAAYLDAKARKCSRFIADVIGYAGLSKEKPLANAHLIAAAPALAEALKRSVRWLLLLENVRCDLWDDESSLRATILACEQALAAARGESEGAK